MYNILVEQFKDTLNREGKDLTISLAKTNGSGVPSKAIKGFFRSVDDSMSNNLSKTYFYCEGQNSLAKGECITDGINYWIALTKDNETIQTDVYGKFLVVKTNYNINFNFDNEIVPIQSIISDTNATLDGTSGVVTQSGKVFIQQCDNADSRRLKVNQRMIIGGGNAYVIISLIFINGIANIWAERTTTMSDDDLANEIPNLKPPEPPKVITYKVTPKVTSVLQGESVTFTFEMLENDVAVPSVWEFSFNGAVVDVNYTFSKISTNVVKITNKKQCRGEPLILTGICSDNHKEVIRITLLGEY